MIATFELLERKSTHLRGDRDEGSISLNQVSPHFALAKGQFYNTPVLVRIGGVPLFSYRVNPGKEILLSVRIYNKEGDLIFWMADNRYWTPSDITVTRRARSLEIVNESLGITYFKLYPEITYASETFLRLESQGYINGVLFAITPDKFFLNKNAVGTFSISNCGVGISMDLWRPPLAIS
jgi:hypothetical protein